MQRQFRDEAEIRSKGSVKSFASNQKQSADLNRVVGIAKPGKWLFSLSHLLRLPLQTSFIASPLEKAFCLTMRAAAYNELIGDHKRREI